MVCASFTLLIGINNWWKYACQHNCSAIRSLLWWTQSAQLSSPAAGTCRSAPPHCFAIYDRYQYCVKHNMPRRSHWLPEGCVVMCHLTCPSIWNTFFNRLNVCLIIDVAFNNTILNFHCHWVAGVMYGMISHSLLTATHLKVPRSGRLQEQLHSPKWKSRT